MPDKLRITQAMIELYDEYTHATLDRRRFVRQLVALTGSAAAAAVVAPLLEASPAAAAIVRADDTRIKAEMVPYPGGATAMSGYFVRPAEQAHRLPGVVVIHENRGLNPHINDVARRVALEGFIALAPDFLTPAGGTPADQDKARAMIRGLDYAATIKNAVAAVEFLKSHAYTTEEAGAIGFCWGGGLVNQLAVHSPRLDAAVAFYGRVPAAADVPKIKAKMLLHYAGLDARINAGLPGYRKALEAAKVAHRIYVYPGVNHAFHNDTAAARYDAKAAKLAWRRTIAFLKEALRG
jgi:carboxymethylenebutenolidase